ncbi:hypothetical protein GCM10008018_56810 [Paenibacillus marchantiophytorum]|uniref:Uncharacterized protein n=1 Tax=Paenibacillus marchantiophytorum TaxID=1619310 RepID=A0ABQ1F9C4_9BACL|nr:hypothetical protein [Paenibacillus marchantiophytorum]GGA03452.1 hypothetical protein GCM10008018_56810 [Paenibacillus marchantiophytorum]
MADLGDIPDAFYHVAALEVPENEKETQQTLKKIDLFPYQLSLST